MRIDTRYPATLLLVLLIGAAQPAVYAQWDATGMSADRQVRLSALLSRVCEAGEEAQLLESFATIGGPGAEQFTLRVLAQGAPEDQRRAAREAARGRYALRSAYLARDTNGPFDAASAERLRAVDEETYVTSAVKTIDLIYRENALRALGVFGSPGAIAAIEAAVEETPSLGLLTAEAVEAIRAR